MSQLSKIAVLFMACALSLSARTQVRGWCEQGNKTVVATGVSGAPKVQGSYPQCTVTVRISPAGALMAIFADDAGTVKANPFTAAVSGYYFFYVDNGKYDITLSGTVAPPFTLSDVVVTNVIGSAAVPTGVGVGNGTAWSGVVAASQLQHLRRKPNVTGTQYEFATEPTLVASDYNFPAQSPADGDLIAGDKLITLTPVPLGVNWNDAGNSHWLYVSGGTDAAGVCYILTTGPGTAVSGAASGTLTLHCAAQHRGAYTVASATGGIAEAVQAAPTTGMTGDSTEIHIPNGATVYAPITIASRKIAFTGAGLYGSGIARSATFVVGHTFHAGAGAIVEFRNMFIGAVSNIPQYASIYCGPGSSVKVMDVQISHGYYGVLNDGAGSLFIRGLIWMNGLTDGAPAAGVRVMSSAAVAVSNVLISDSYIGGYTTGANRPFYSIWLSGVDGAMISNTGTGGSNVGILLEGAVGKWLLNIWVENVVIDTYEWAGIAFTGTGLIANVRIANSHLNPQHAGANSGGIDMGSIWSSGSPDYVQIIGNNIDGNERNGIMVGGTVNGSKSILIANNRITDNNQSVGGYSGIMLATGSTGFHIVDNIIGNKWGYGSQTYGIHTAGTLADSQISGNDLADNVFGGAGLGGAFTGVISDNKGIDDVIGSVASGATIAAPLNSIFTVTGTTTLTTINGGWTGREITLIFTNAAPGGVGTGGNIAKAQTVSQNQALPLVFNGTKWYPGGGGASGGGTGDVVGPAASVDDEVALFSSTTGKIIKRSALTGILKSASGVAAVAGANDVSGPQFCVSAAGSDAYACNLAPAITSYVTGTHYRFKADVANTGVASVSFNGIGVIPLKKAAGGVTTDLATNDVRAGQWVDLVYDGTNMQVQSLLGNSPAVTADAVSGASALKTANTVAVVDSAGVVKEATGVTIAAGVVTATGFSGPLTGAVTGNASTATALAANPAACSNQVVTDMAANGTLVCASVVEDMLGLTNVTTGDVSASAHGLAKKISVHATDDPTGACTLGQTYHNYATPSLWECVQTGAATTAWRLKLISTGTGAGSIQFPTSGAMSVGAASTVKIGAHTGDVLGVSLNGGAVKTVMATDTVLLEAQHPAHDGDATSSAGDLTLALAAKFRTLTKSITLLDPVAGDSGSVQLVFGQAVTITRVWCSTKTATSTVTINLEERAEATPDTAGTEVLTSALVCDTDTQASTTFSNAGIAARVPLALTIASVANAPAVVRVHLEHTID